MGKQSSVIVSMRVSPAAKERMYAAADKAGMPFNEFSRLVLLNAADALLSVNEREPENLETRFALIGRMLKFKLLSKQVDYELEKLSSEET